MFALTFLLIILFHFSTCFDADDCASNSFRILSTDSYEDYQLNVISKGEEIRNFHEAQRICQLCYDGLLLVGNETKDIPGSYLNWIGLYRSAESVVWTWSNGEPLDDWKNYAQEFRHRFLQANLDYSVLAYRKLEKIIWVAINDEKFHTSGRLMAMMDNVLPREYYDLVVDMPLGAACRVPVHADCHYWNYTEPKCVWDDTHGCHGYASTMALAPDNSTVACDRPSVERFAFPCNETQCTRCSVGQWSPWSACSARLCRDGDGTKVRSRKMLDKNCPEESFYVHLKQTASCSIDGCDDLYRRNQRG